MKDIGAKHRSYLACDNNLQSANVPQSHTTLVVYHNKSKIFNGVHVVMKTLNKIIEI